MKQLPNYCPIPMPDGADCWRTSEPDGYAGICTEHMHDVATAWVGERRLTRIRCEGCQQLQLIPDRLARLAMCDNCGSITKLEQPDTDTRDLSTSEPHTAAETFRPRTDVVYYIRFGNRIKIGTSTNLPRRMIVLPHDEILAIEPGDRSREHARHRQFAATLVPGQQEWFEVTPALLSHTAALRQRHGAPMAAWRRWMSRAA